MKSRNIVAVFFALMVLAEVLFAIGCASARTQSGAVDVQVVLSDANWGLTFGCVTEWLSPDVCTFGKDAIATAQAIAAKNQPGMRAAVRQSLVDAEARLPAGSRLRPYLDAVIALLVSH